MDERLQKILAQWGVASRRRAEEMILSGRVLLNGERVQLGQKANPYQDLITVDGIPLQPHQRPQPLYLLLNKPLGVVTTCHEQRGRKKVLDLLPPSLAKDQGLHPVGRLDVDSTGALLLTNDGNLTFALTHPRQGIPKTYEVKIMGHPSHSILQLWREGVMLSGRQTLPAQVKVLKSDTGGTFLEIIMTEGRNRQIRRVADLLGYPVVQLHRTAIGSIYLHPPEKPELPIGHYRFLEEKEVHFLQAITTTKNYLIKRI